MKCYYYAIITCLCSYSFGQNSSTHTEIKKLEPAKSSVHTLTPLTSSDSLAGRTIKHCQTVIDAIDSKVEYIRSNPEEHAKALASNWYERMAKKREAWVADRDELIRRENQK